MQARRKPASRALFETSSWCPLEGNHESPDSQAMQQKAKSALHDETIRQCVAYHHRALSEAGAHGHAISRVPGAFDPIAR